VRCHYRLVLEPVLARGEDLHGIRGCGNWFRPGPVVQARKEHRCDDREMPLPTGPGTSSRAR
jgi:hypothetical protein